MLDGLSPQTIPQLFGLPLEQEWWSCGQDKQLTGENFVLAATAQISPKEHDYPESANEEKDILNF